MQETSTSADSRAAEPIGVVVIGRNEGERLKRCLRSLLSQGAKPVVYVDSGSDDGSVEFARSVDVAVVNLDTSRPFTMARGRNAGLEYIQREHPALGFVHFIDGDCEVEEGWIDCARDALKTHRDVGVVAGMRRERNPQASVYNRLMDMEWRGPIGEVKALGGDALYRTEVLLQAGSFRPEMIAGEEPELCARIRRHGWKVLRLEMPMTKHDAAIYRFGQWWRRSIRAGHARAEGMTIHWGSGERYNVKETASIVLYGLVIPGASVAVVGAAAVGAPALSGPVTGAVLAADLALYGRIFLNTYKTQRRRFKDRHAAQYAAFIVVGKFSEAWGVGTYFANRLRRRRTELIDYKRQPPS